MGKIVKNSICRQRNIICRQRREEELEKYGCARYKSLLLITAAATGHEDIGKFYIENGASMYGLNGNRSVLELAVQSESLELMKCMMRHNFDIRTVNSGRIGEVLMRLMKADRDKFKSKRKFYEDAMKLLTGAGVEFQQKTFLHSLQDLSAVAVRRCLTQNGGNTFSQVRYLCMMRDEDELPVVTKRAVEVLLNDIELL